MNGLLGLSSGGIKLPSFLSKNKIVASNGDATISNRKYSAVKNVARPTVKHSNDARIEKYNPLQNC
jgi:hypothetical protein